MVPEVNAILSTFLRSKTGVAYGLLASTLSLSMLASQVMGTTESPLTNIGYVFTFLNWTSGQETCASVHEWMITRSYALESGSTFALILLAAHLFFSPGSFSAAPRAACSMWLGAAVHAELGKPVLWMAVALAVTAVIAAALGHQFPEYSGILLLQALSQVALVVVIAPLFAYILLVGEPEAASRKHPAPD